MGSSSDNKIAPVNSDVLGAKMHDGIRVGHLESSLLAAFPAEDACEWDRNGMLVGDNSQKVAGVGICLDPTIEVISQAVDAGDNVIVSHHPAFLDPPQAFAPSSSGCYGSGAVVWEAVRAGIALINFHTPLDVSLEASLVLPHLLGLDFSSVLDPIPSNPAKGFGQICTVKESDGKLSLGQLAARATSVFGSFPRVWGKPAAALGTVVTCTGSAGELAHKALRSGADCLVCGEIKYHAALDALQSGLCIIELGHDVSEIPLCALLAQAVVDAGVAQEKVHLLDQRVRWWTPESVRR